MSGKRIKIKDIVKIQSGYAFKSKLFNDNKGLPVIRIRNVTSQSIDTFYDGEYSEEYIVNQGDLLISMDGEFKIIKWKNGKGLLNQRVCRIRIINEEVILKDYLLYLLPRKLRDIEDKTSFVTVKHLSVKDINNIDLILPPLETQKKIVEVLDKAQCLIDARKEQIRMMDELIQSVFYEMFGDPVTNPKGWANQRLDSICTKIGSGATPRGGKSSYKAEGISLIRSMNVHNGAFKYDELAFIDNTQAKKLNNVIVEQSDVLLNITGASVARSCIVPEKILPARVNQHVSIIRVNKEKANSRYINKLFISSSFQKMLMKIATSGGATREAITKEQLNELYIPIPNIRLQNDFDIFVQKTEANKNLLLEALIDLETNYYSLLQKSFRGELYGDNMK